MVFAILVFDTGNTGATVRVVFNLFYGRRSAGFQLEIEQPVITANSPTAMAGSYTALVIARYRAFFDNCQTLQRLLGCDAVKVLGAHATAGWSSRIVGFNRHKSSFQSQELGS